MKIRDLLLSLALLIATVLGAAALAVAPAGASAGRLKPPCARETCHLANHCDYIPDDINCTIHETSCTAAVCDPY
jgi:hypothetical protein